MPKCDPCLTDWKRQEKIRTLIPSWYDCNQLPQITSKRQMPSPYKRAQTQKTAVIGNGRSKWLIAAVVKIHMKLWYIDYDNENDADFSYDLSDFGSQSDNSNSDIY